MPLTHEKQLITKIRELPPNRVAEVENFVDFIKHQEQKKMKGSAGDPLDFPIDNIGPWPEDISLSRKDFYDDQGR